MALRADFPEELHGIVPARRPALAQAGLETVQQAAQLLAGSDPWEALPAAR